MIFPELACIVGARPNFMKMAPILEELRKRGRLTARLIHTGQHFSPEMSDAFFRDLDMPPPDESLGVPPSTPVRQIADMLQRLEGSFAERRPAAVVVVGDVNSTVAAALAASKMDIPVAHVEAGLRSFDRSMPEEINRVVTDAISDYLFVTEASGVRNLRLEGVPESRIFFTGNVMIDTLLRFRDRARESGILARLQVAPRSYAAVTLHRPANVDDLAKLKGLAKMLTRLAKQLPVVFPVHPRTCARLEALGLEAPGLHLIAPLGYLDFLRLMSEARLVLTDSGGIQEETTILGVPCVTLRENTERPVTIEMGTNRLAGVDPEKAYAAALEVLGAPWPETRVPELWDGRASSRIVDVLERNLGG